MVGMTRSVACLEVKRISMILFRAAEIMMHTGSVVSLEMVKLAAVYYGFEGVFTQSPQTTCKGMLSKQHYNTHCTALQKLFS